MRVFDLIGNVLKSRDMLYFEPLKALVQVTDIKEPGIIDENAPGVLVLELKIPFRLEKGQKDVRLGDFLKTHDPGEGVKVQALVDDIVNHPLKRPLSLAKGR